MDSCTALPPRTRRFRGNAFLLACCFGVLLGSAPGRLQAQGGPATVVVAPVVERQLAATQSFVANVNPHRRSVIGSAVDGRVLDFLVDAGQEVKAGEPLAQLRTRTIEIEIAAAEAELKLRQAELAELENGSRPDEIALAEALRQVAVATNEYAQAKLDRLRRLFETSAGLSQDEYEAARSEALVAQAKVAEAQSSLSLVQEGPRQEQIDQARARVDVQKQVVEGLKDRLEKYTLRAPFTGFVAAELTEAGAWVQQGAAVAEVIEVDPVEIEVYMPESSIRFVRVGAPATVTLETFRDKVFEGTIEHIVPLADARARTFPVRVVVDNPKVDSGHELLPGMLARVSLPTGEQRSRLLVPKDALQLGGASPTVLKVIDGKAAPVTVRTGPSMGSWIAVDPAQSGALSTEDVVVTRGNERLRPGQQVSIARRQDPPQELP